MKAKGHSKLLIHALVFVTLLLCTATTIKAAPGDLDPTFGIGGRLVDGGGYAYDVAVQSDGKIVVVRGYLADFVVTRYNQDGSPDTTFGFGTGKVITDLGGEEYAWSIVIQPDGKIVAGGVSTIPGAASFFIVRYNSDGSFDTGFGGGTGKVLTALPCGDPSDNYGADFTIQPDGKLVGAVRFEYCTGHLIRYESDGSLDVSFGNHGFVTEPIGGTSYIGGSSLTSVFIQPNNGKVIWGFEYSGVYRYEPNGSPDLSFGSGGHVSCPFSHLRSVIIQPDGKIVALGSYPGSSALVRYNIDGSPDTSFGLNGLVTAPTGLYLGSAVIQPDGKIVAAGSSTGINGTSDFTLVRYNGDGSLDGTFGGGDGITTVDFNNSSDGASDVALDSQGRAVVVGQSGGMFAVARFLGDAPSPACSSANPIDCPDFFIRQHYRDFLGREPDAPGLAHWTSEITMCSDVANQLPGESEAQCIDRKRTNTSGAFYLSNEFQNSANFLIRVNWGSLGQDRVIGRKCIAGQHSALDAVCRPLYSDYIADLAKLTQGIVVNDTLDPNAISINKHNFVNEFVTRADFLAAYPSTMTAGEYVDKLVQTTGIPLTDQERADLIAKVGADGRAAVLYDLVDGTTTIDGGVLRFDTRYGKAYYDQEFNPAFVFVEYLGYLRRNPDQGGFDHWLGKLNLYGNFVDAEMVRAFIVSDEYRRRFGPN